MSEELNDNQDPSPHSPGTILKRCREFHGISLNDAAETTKIGINYLLALEEDRPSEFASVAYLKGFLRIYAAYLGLNADDMIRLYERLYEQEAVQGSATAALGSAFPARRRRFNWRKLVLPIFLLLLMIISSFFVARIQEPVIAPADLARVNVEPAPVQPVLSSATKKPVDVVEKKGDTTAEKEEKKLPEQAEAKLPEKAVVVAPPETRRSFVVRMKALQGVQLKASIDGTSAQAYELNAGDVIEWKAEERIGLELSDGGGIEAAIDDKPLKAFGVAGKPVYVVLKPGGVVK